MMDVEGPGDVGNGCDSGHGRDVSSGACLCPGPIIPPGCRKGHQGPVPRGTMWTGGLSGPLCVFQLTPGREG